MRGVLVWHGAGLVGDQGAVAVDEQARNAPNTELGCCCLMSVGIDLATRISRSSATACKTGPMALQGEHQRPKIHDDPFVVADRVVELTVAYVSYLAHVFTDLGSN